MTVVLLERKEAYSTVPGADISVGVFAESPLGDLEKIQQFVAVFLVAGLGHHGLVLGCASVGLSGSPDRFHCPSIVGLGRHGVPKHFVRTRPVPWLDAPGYGVTQPRHAAGAQSRKQAGGFGAFAARLLYSRCAS